MNNKSERISKAMKLIGKVTVDTLPDVLSLISVIGIPIGTGAKILIGGVNENQEINETVEINNQFEELKDAINQKLISAKEIIEIIQTQVISQVYQKDEKKPVYMFGIIIYSFSGEIIDEDIKEELRKVFSGEYIYEDNFKKLSENIMGFVSEYFGVSINERDEYYFLNDKLIMNFGTDKYIRNEQDVLTFIVNINEFLDQDIFLEYTIF